MSDHEERPGAAAAFRLARAVQEILRRFAKESRQNTKTCSARRRYKQASDNSSWFEERAGQVKALVEAGALRERERVLQAIFDAVAALRAQHGFPSKIRLSLLYLENSRQRAVAVP